LLAEPVAHRIGVEAEALPLREGAVQAHGGARTDRIVLGGDDLHAGGDLLLQRRKLLLARQHGGQRRVEHHAGGDAAAHRATALRMDWNMVSAVEMICAAAWSACCRRSMFAASSSRLTA